MAARLRIVYNEVLNAANRLESEAHEIGALYQHLQNETEQLHHAGLRGYTSDAWYKDMHETLLPKTKQLADILSRTSHLLKSLNSAFQNTEQEAGGLFKTRA